MSPAELERLAVLVEELGEAAQAVGKVLRFGYENRYDAGQTNREQLTLELGHVKAAAEVLENAGDVDKLELHDHATRKHVKLRTFFKHQLKL